MRIGVPREIFAGEKRVATTPDVATQLIKMGYEVMVESNAGAAANLSDTAYAEVGCTIADSTATVWADSDIILKVRGPEEAEADLLKQGQTIISFLWPAQNPELLQKLTEQGVTALGLESTVTHHKTTTTAAEVVEVGTGDIFVRTFLAQDHICRGIPQRHRNTTTCPAQIQDSGLAERLARNRIPHQYPITHSKRCPHEHEFSI